MKRFCTRHKHFFLLATVALVSAIILLTGGALAAASPTALPIPHFLPLAAKPTPDPARPATPATIPTLVAPYQASSGDIELWCGPGCGNHKDSAAEIIKTYYAVDYGQTGSQPFSIRAVADGTATERIIAVKKSQLLGKAQQDCPDDLNPDTPDIYEAKGVFIDHGSGWTSFYLHMSSVSLPPDRKVKVGQVIGQAGCTGSNSIHLHFDLRWYDTESRTFWTYPVSFAEEPTGGGLDLAILIDTTSSMWDDIDAAKARAAEIVGQVKTKNPNSRIAVIEYRDFPSRTGDDRDFPYHDVLPFTFDADQAVAAINALTLGYGGDIPETRNCALMHVMASDTCAGNGEASTLGPWRPDVEKAIIYLTDAPALSPEPFTNFTNAGVLAEANSGGFILSEGTEEVIVGAAADEPVDGIAVYPIVIGSDATTRADAEEIAAGTGGKVFESETADGVVDAILAAIDTIIGSSSVYLPAISSAPSSPCEVGSYFPWDVAFVLDRSRTAWESFLTDAAKKGTRAYLAKMDLAPEQAAILSFHANVTVDQTLTTDAALVNAALDRLRKDAGSAIGDAIVAAKNELTSGRHTGGNQQAIVLYTDGEVTSGQDAIAAAQQAKQAGIRIIAVGIGANVYQDVMRSIASSPGDFYYVPNRDDVPAVMSGVADKLRCGQ